MHAVVQKHPEALPCTDVQNEQCPINSPGKAQKTGLATGEDHYKLLVQDQVRAESPQYLSALRVSFLHHRRWDSNQPPITCGHIPSLPRELGSPFDLKPATPRFNRRVQKNRNTKPHFRQRDQLRLIGYPLCESRPKSSAREHETTARSLDRKKSTRKARMKITPPWSTKT